MKHLSRVLTVYLAFAVLPPPLCADELPAKGGLYFPPDQGLWETVEPERVGWDGGKIQKALDYAGEHRSSGVVILYKGRILAEQYFEVQGGSSARYRERILNRDQAGRPIEDVASVQKSVASILVGTAQQKGLLKIDDPVSEHLGVGWSRATSQQEAAITIRHLITMTSGLSAGGAFAAPPGTKWRYNTQVYAKSMDVVVAAAGMDRHALTRQWLTQPLGMSDSKWVERESAGLQAINRYGFATTARDLARFGLMTLAGGKWRDKAVLADQQYLKDATTTSQKMNPFYGYLWWLNHNANEPGGVRRLAAAPRDTFSANGALNRRCFVTPSLQLVVTRLGDAPSTGGTFDRVFWKLLMDAAPKTSREKEPKE